MLTGTDIWTYGFILKDIDYVNIKQLIMKSTIYATLIILFVSCDYYGDYHYEVKNELNIEITVITDRDTFDIPNGNQVRILSTVSGNIGRNEDPLDIFSDMLADLGIFDLYVDDELIEKDFRQRDYWEFQMNGNQSSTYLLRVTEDILED